MKKWVLIGLAVLVFGAVIARIVLGNRHPGREVEMAEVARKDLVETVTASGTIEPKRSVDVSAITIGKITRLAVKEGDWVDKGDFLLEIDPTEYRSVVEALEAGVRTSQANLALAEASAEKANLDLQRAEELYAQGLQSEEQLQAARTNAKVERARVESARATLSQQQANLAKARYDLEKVTITAPMSGIITRLNVEEGESAIMGTMNNPGTVLLVIADLSAMEAVVQVDETEVVKVALGQKAGVEIDAFPDSTFPGHVTEIGNSPIYTGGGTGQQAVDFEVKATLDRTIPNIRPGLSAKADITVATREKALAVPLGAVTVRKWPPEPRATRRRGMRRSREAAESREEAAADTTGAAAADTASAKTERKDVEGVFVVEDGAARFRPVTLGITGEDDFEILSGVEEGQTIVTGPFRILRDLQDGDPVRRKHEGRRRGDDGDDGDDGD